MKEELKITEEETHIRIFKTDRDWLKKHREEMPLHLFLHYIIQFYKAKNK